MISIAEYAKLNLNLLSMFHQIAPGWDVLESGEKECNYWVHSVCKGFGDTSEEVQRLNFYCPEHNKRVQTMRQGVNNERKCGIRTSGGKRK